MNAQQLDNTPLSQRPNRILTEDLSKRLQGINKARTALAQLGCTVVAQKINQGTKKRSQLELKAATPALTKLVIAQRAECGTDVVYCARFGDVLIYWNRVEMFQ